MCRCRGAPDADRSSSGLSLIGGDEICCGEYLFDVIEALLGPVVVEQRTDVRVGQFAASSQGREQHVGVGITGAVAEQVCGRGLSVLPQGQRGLEMDKVNLSLTV